MTTILTQLEEIQQAGEYTNYVFKNLEPTKWDNVFFLCTRYPRWEHRELKKGEIGFVTFTEVKAGEEYYNHITKEVDVYNHSHIRFDKFIDKKSEEDNTIVI